MDENIKSTFPPEIDGCIDGYKVRSFPWIDRKRIYFNVQYYAPGQSLCKPPAWDRTVYIVNNEARHRTVAMFPSTLVAYVAAMSDTQFPPGGETQLEIQSAPKGL